MSGSSLYLPLAREDLLAWSPGKWDFHHWGAVKGKELRELVQLEMCGRALTDALCHEGFVLFSSHPENKRALLNSADLVAKIQRCSSSLASRSDSNVTLQGRKRSCILLERRVRVQYPVSQHRSDISAFQHQDSVGHWPMTVISACCSIFLGCWKVMPAWTALQPPLSPMLSSISLVIFGYTQRTRSKYALTALVTLTFSSETLLSSTGLDYDLKLAASYCWLSIHEWNPCSSEDDAHQQYSTAASLFWINKTCSSFLNSVFFSVWSLSHLYLMEEAAL